MCNICLINVSHEIRLYCFLYGIQIKNVIAGKVDSLRNVFLSTNHKNLTKL